MYIFCLISIQYVHRMIHIMTTTVSVTGIIVFIGIDTTVIITVICILSHSVFVYPR